MAAAQARVGSVGSRGGSIGSSGPSGPGSLAEPASDVCPRCRCGFHCGAADATPCACTTLTLGAPLLARLRRDYNACLCVACLAELAAADNKQDATPASAQNATTEPRT